MTYLDFSATTPIYKEIANDLPSIALQYPFNPSGRYKEAIKTKNFYENQRKYIADYLNVSADNIVFTSSATESNNTVLKGLNYKDRSKVIIWALEHKSVLKQDKFLKDLGADIHIINNRKPFITKDTILPYLDSNTKIVCIMHVNNELGSLNNIEEIAEAIKSFDRNILIMCDMVQSFGKTKLNLENIDFATFSSHKIGGLRGIAGLYIKNKDIIHPLIEGGGQENNIRSGTENVLGAYSFAKALEITKKKFNANWDKLETIRNDLVDFCKKNGFVINSPENSVPYIFNFSTLKLPSEAVINYLSDNDIAISSGSACDRGKSSSVLKNLGFSDIIVNTSLRVSIHPDTTFEEIDCFKNKLLECIDRFAI
ncbi:aminotransferase, class V [Deferribacter desulfuricans SSM1]|uniref:Aminotransferase, class V n=1 Tax=Deferribacter desulfuricans (strain DSM 14783 / JCM 11476 / NBRC 101012 / SSM1) TaxID=639282 RepID=D3P9K5_DEFDS|nr:cysteine desulfurase family protein [Deferribacter desulfuricans]BAI81395.1 aminotransferase, class V [Deferribacter desulfuricans SSM1]